MNDLLHNRTEKDLIVQILVVCKDNEATKLQIMDEVCLADRECEVYLSLMVNEGLLRHCEETKKYKATETGLRLVRATKLSE